MALRTVREEDSDVRERAAPAAAASGQPLSCDGDDELAMNCAAAGDLGNNRSRATAMWGFAPRYTPPKAADPAKTPAPAAPAPAPEVREQRELDNLADLPR